MVGKRKEEGGERREQCHILNEDGIYPTLLQLVEQLAGGLQLVVVDDGVDGDIDLSLELMGVAAQLGNIGHAVASSSTGTEALRTNIDSIGTVVDGSLTTLQVLSRSQQFEFSHHLLLLTSYFLPLT